MQVWKTMFRGKEVAVKIYNQHDLTGADVAKFSKEVNTMCMVDSEYVASIKFL